MSGNPTSYRSTQLRLSIVYEGLNGLSDRMYSLSEARARMRP